MSESAEALLRRRAMESMLRKKSDTNESRPVETKGAPLPPPASAPPMHTVRAPVEDKEDGEIEDEITIAPSESVSSAISETGSNLGEMTNATEGVSFGIKSVKPKMVSKGSNLDVGGQNPLSEGTKTTSTLEGSAKNIFLALASRDKEPPRPLEGTSGSVAESASNRSGSNAGVTAAAPVRSKRSKWADADFGSERLSASHSPTVPLPLPHPALPPPAVPPPPSPALPPPGVLPPPSYPPPDSTESVIIKDTALNEVQGAAAPMQPNALEGPGSKPEAAAPAAPAAPGRSRWADSPPASPPPASPRPARSKWNRTSPSPPPPAPAAVDAVAGAAGARSKWSVESPGTPGPPAETPGVAGKGRAGKWETPSPRADDEDAALGKRKAGGGRADTEGLMRAATATGDAAAALDLLENRLRGPVGRTGGADGGDGMEVVEIEGAGGEDGNFGGPAEGGEGEQPDAAVEAAAVEAARRGGGLHRCRDVDTAYHKLNKIDEGTYGVVYRARCRLSDRIVALKQVKLERAREGFPLTALRELTVLLELRHANIVDVFEVVVSPKKQVFMVMEYMDHDFRSLMESMTRPFRTSEVKCLMQQLLSGVEYMHRHWVIHRDLKTSNLLLDNRGVLKVCDFGLARLYREPIKSMTPEVVTLWYRAPELLFGEKTYTTAIDQWSVGCIMAELVLKEPILRGRNEQEQRDKIVEMMGTPSEDNWPGFSLLPGAKGLRYKKRSCCLRDKLPKVSYTGGPSLSDVGYDLLLRMLDYDPARRLGAGEALKHGWFSEAPLAVKTEDMPTFPSMHEVPKNQRKLKRGLDEDHGPSQAFFNDDIRFNREMKA